MNDKEFWTEIRRGLLYILRAICKKFELPD